MYSNNLVTTARQAPSRASTMPAISTSKAIVHNNCGGVRRRVQSAIPSPRTTSMNIDDLLTISTTDVNMSKYRASLHKRVHNQTLQHYKEEDGEHKQQDAKSVQNSESMATITDNSIKVKVVLGRQSQPKQQAELPMLPKNNKQESKHFNLITNKQQSLTKKSCSNSKLSPLIGTHSKLPIGTLNGNSFYLTCKNKSS